MNSAFDMNKLQSLLKDCYEITQLRVSVFDTEMNELLAYPQENQPICRVVRATEAGILACRSCDRTGCERAARSRETLVYSCHAGLIETISPLYVNNVHVGYLWFGQVLAYPDHTTALAELKKNCASLDLDQEALEEVCLNSPLIPEQKIRASANILQAIASFLVMDKMATLKSDNENARLNQYLNEHYMDKITAEGVCERFGFGKTKLYRMLHQMYGCSLTEQVRKLRINQALKLLEEQQQLPISEIALQCGFPDYNYFISVFSGQIGIPPGEYRRRLQK